MFSLRKDEDISCGVESFPVTYHSSDSQIQGLFKYVKTNIPGPGINRDKFTEQFSGCSCNGTCTVGTCLCLQLFGDAYDDGAKLKNIGIHQQSSKPILECGHACSCQPARCKNRVVQHGIQNSFCVFHTKSKGFGLMLHSQSENVIPCLSFVCEYAGEVVGHEEALRRIQETDATKQNNYLIAVKEHVSGTETCTYIDPHYMGNLGRFINHSCDPNLFMLPVRVNHPIPRLALFARKNIQPGEELTFDYSGNATLNTLLPAITNVTFSDSSHGTIAPSKIDTEKSKIYLCDSLIDKLTQSEESIDPPFTKRRKFHQISNSENYMPVITSTNSETERQYLIYNDINDSKKEADVTDVQDVQRKAINTKIVTGKPCFCNSFNCTGFLPLDSNLLHA